MADKKIKDTEVQITMADTNPEDIEVEVEEITEYRQLSPGDQIAVAGVMKGVPYFHHGIFVGGKVGVIHYGGENKKDATIKDDDLTIFWGDKRLVKITYPNLKPKDPTDVIKTAERLKEKRNEWGEYDLFRNNCEHFATYCKIGKGVSTQVNKKISSLLENTKKTAAVLVVAGASSLVIAASSNRK